MNAMVKFYTLLMLAGIGMATPAHADKLQDIRDALAEKKAQHAVLEKKAKQISAEVTMLSDNLVKSTRDLQESEDALADGRERLEDLQKKKAQALEDLYRQNRRMGGFVSAARKYSQTSAPAMFLKEEPLDAARASLVMKSMIPALHAQSSKLKDELARINAIETDIAAEIAEQTTRKKKLDGQKVNLSALVEKRKKLYASTENERAVQEKAVAELTRESRNLEELMANIKAKSKNGKSESKVASSTKLPSGMLVPVRGTLHTGFGDKNELGAQSRGITFAVEPGARVVVPLAGTVKFAGPFQNYKQLLIVEHAGGYHSLLAGMGTLDTVAGATLTAGEPVGMADTSSTPRIYYELRFNGKPVNPKNILAGRKKQEKS